MQFLEDLLKRGSIHHGKCIHTFIIETGYKDDVFVGSSLIYMYAKYGRMKEAHKLFLEMPNHNAVTWNTMITGYVEHEQVREAFQAFEKMLYTGTEPTDATFISILKASASIDPLYLGEVLHAFVVEGGFDVYIMILTTLVGMYTKCRRMKDALWMFWKLPKRNMVSWGIMIGGYADHGNGLDALSLFEQMQQEGLPPNAVIFLSLLKACTSITAIGKGMLIHHFILELDGNMDENLTSTLIDMYVKGGSMIDACAVFSKLSQSNVATWTTLIDGYGVQGHGSSSLQLFKQMQQQGQNPNDITFFSILKACINIGSLHQTMFIHVQIVENEYELDALVGIALIDVYVKCGSILHAHKVFDKLSKENVSTWNAMIAGYVQAGLCDEAIHLFHKMMWKGIQPNNVTFATTMKSCCGISAKGYGKLLHTLILEHHEEMDAFVCSALIYFYVKFACLAEGRRIFDMLPEHHLVAWNAIITGYAEQGHCHDALHLFGKMLKGGVEPDTITFVSVLQGCSAVAALDEGQLIHIEAVKTFGEVNLIIGNALIHFYVNSNSIDNASSVFDALANRDVVSWSTMIAGFARHNNHRMVLQLFSKMQEEDIKPNKVTFVNLFSACSHLGLDVEAFHLLEEMEDIHGVAPAVDHYNSLIDVLGRTGRLLEAEDLSQTMPFQANIVGWTALLGHCRVHGNVKLGLDCFHHFTSINCRHASGYILMSELSWDAGLYDYLDTIQDLRAWAGAWKKPGEAFILVNNEVIGFVGGNNYESHLVNVHAKTFQLSSQAKVDGLIPHLDKG